MALFLFQSWKCHACQRYTFYSKAKRHTQHCHGSSVEGDLEPWLQGASTCLEGRRMVGGGGRGGWSCRSWRTVGAEGHKSQPPAEQGHQIKVCCYDLVQSAVKAAADNCKERKLVVPLVSSQINTTYRLKDKRFEVRY